MTSRFKIQRNLEMIEKSIWMLTVADKSQKNWTAHTKKINRVLFKYSFKAGSFITVGLDNEGAITFWLMKIYDQN